MAVAIRERFAADAGPYISLPEGTDLSERGLRGLNLTRVVFERVNMSEADLSGANLENAVMVQVNIDTTTKLAGANMAGIRITASTLSCDLSGINLSGASI